jgi:integrase
MVEALIPNDRGAYYSEAGWRQRRLKTFAEAGIGHANFRELRPTFAQRLKDRGAPIETVSKALRHSSTATTERFYARIRTERAWLELERVWESSAPNSIPP